MKQESPTFVKISLAAAMTLGLQPGRFWRDAKMTCVNLLLHYENGCKANCAYCGLSRSRLALEKTFIRVPWHVHSMDNIIARLKKSKTARRTCISMVTHRRACDDTLTLTGRLVHETPQPVSVLISPTIMDETFLQELRTAGAEKIGIAIDAATPELFDRLRGRGVRGPHQWDVYWNRLAQSMEIFGKQNVGVHFICGLGETEQELVRIFQRARDAGCPNHLFSFYPEQGSSMEHNPQPPLDAYRRIQIACHLIDEEFSHYDKFEFDSQTGRITNFGVTQDVLNRLIDSGTPFMTRGCKGCSGQVDCNRPFGNSPPGEGLRNYPFEPTGDDIALIRTQIIYAPRHDKRTITFSIPNTKQYHTDVYSNRGGNSFLGVSITGRECRLLCDHCKAKLLEHMIPTPTPELLWKMASEASGRGTKGMLISGGCDSNGIVPLIPFAQTLSRIKKELGLRLAVHSKLVDRRLAEALAPTGIDAVMVDVVDTDVLQQVYHLNGKTLKDISDSLDLLKEYHLPAAPHIILGLGNGAHGCEDDIGHELELINLLRGRRLKSLVLVFLMPLPRTPLAHAEPYPLRKVNRLFAETRRLFPEIPVHLGCAKPAGDYQIKVETLALKHGFNGIAFPSEEVIALARKRHFAVRFEEICCALIE